VAEQFTGLEGKYVPVDQTVASFKEILEGKHDDIPERAFLLKGTIDEVVEAAKGAREEEKEKKDDSDSEGEGEDEAKSDDEDEAKSGDEDEAKSGDEDEEQDADEDKKE
jgi:F-type H+-transporting ATPase subunit beta